MVTENLNFGLILLRSKELKMKMAILSALMGVWLCTLLVTAKQQELRVDAEQEDYESFTFEGEGDEPSSTLFSSCLATGRMVDAKLASIQIDGSSNEWERYVPDSTQMDTAITWEDPPSTATIASIADCAAVADSEDKVMFKYDGGSSCKFSDSSYDTTDPPMCETDETDAVFILASTTEPASTTEFVPAPLTRSN